MHIRMTGSSNRAALLPLVALGIVVTLAWMLSARVGGGLLAPVQWLARYEAFHLVGHWIIFGGIAWLARSQCRARTWAYVLIGGVLLEVAQAVGGNNPLSAAMLRASAFDLGIDALGALTGPAVFRVIAAGRRAGRLLGSVP